MEDNIAKLLQIAGGVLLGVILLSLVSYFFSSIGLLPSIEDEMETSEQLAKFNLEYEIYDKKAMYGVDVISCLNKANSNNLKYAEGGSFLTGNRYGRDFYIDVYVRLTSDKALQETLEYYYFQSGTGTQVQGFEEEIDVKMLEAKLEVKDDYYTTFSNDTKIGNKTVEIKDSREIHGVGIDPILPKGGSYSLEKEGVELEGYYSLVNDDNIKRLIELSNKSDNGNLNKISVNNNSATLGIWSRVIWKTALSDFKTRKFKCDYLGYSSKTSRVCELYFSEL